MRLWALGCVGLAAVAISPVARAYDTGKCTIQAATQLPRVAGLVIKTSSVRAISDKEASDWWKDQPRPVFIDILVNAAGQDVTYVFLCGESKFGMFARPLPDGKMPR
jgi:hypothetical protein